MKTLRPGKSVTGNSPYSKRPKNDRKGYDYSSMYNRFPNLRRRPALSSFPLLIDKEEMAT